MTSIPTEILLYIARQVKEGFNSREEIIQDAIDYAFEGHNLNDAEPQIEELTDRLLTMHAREQATWRGPTDCDKLDAAFAALEQKGIVARQNFTCCSNCGHSEIWGEIEEAKLKKEVKGYAFYHMQDTERACEGGSLYVKYGAVADDQEKIAEVGKVIAEALKQSELQVDWNGQPDTAIGIIQLKWRRRR